MKCCKCLIKKGERECARYDGIVCSECCGKTRHIKYCGSSCKYMQQRCERVDTSTVELTEVGRGKVISFSDSLFLPDILECFYCDVEQIDVNIIEPTRISFSASFVIKKMVDRDVSMREAYIVDSWKKNERSSVGVPFLQIYAIGLGKLNNVSLSVDKINQKVEVENNHVDTWLPSAYSKIKKLTRKEIIETFKGGPSCDRALIYYGKHFLGNNSTLFTNIMINKKYRLKLEVIYEMPQFREKTINLPFGLFWPFKLVNYKKFNLNCSRGIDIEPSSSTMLMLPFEEKHIVCETIPLLQDNAILSSPKCISFETNELEEPFHYDNYCILNNFFKLKLHSTAIAKSIFSDLPILTGLYDAFNKVYNDEYAPASVIICNNSSRIEKFKIECEIMGISYKYIKEVFVEPYRVDRIKVAPRLIEDKVKNIRINTEFDICVRVTNPNLEIIYEETSRCLLYPREVFIDILKNKTKDWKIDLRSFLARWITPTNKLIEEIIAEAAKNLPNGIQGASSGNNNIMQREMKSIYDCLSRSIRYVARPLAFAEGDYHAQNISLPSTTLRCNSGNCIDLSVLLASCFETLKLHTYIVLVPGHAFLKVELPREELIYLESTYIGKKEYFEAVESARDKYEEYFSEKGPKVDGAYEVDVMVARKSNILPME